MHLDHAGGAGEMMRQFEQASLIIHPLGARHMIDPSRLVAGTISVYGEQRFERLYGSIEPISEERIIIAEDLSSYSLGQRELILSIPRGMRAIISVSTINRVTAFLPGTPSASVTTR